MADIRVARLAKLLTEYCVDVQPGDRVAVLGSTLAEPLMLAVQREILRAGGHPHLMPSFPETDYTFYSEANDDQLGYVSPFAELAFTEFEGLIQVMSSANTKALNNIDPARQGMRMKAMTPLMKIYMERAASKDLKWVITMFPTHAFAQDAEMSLTELEDFVYATTYTDTEDPIGDWRRIHEEQQRLVEWLAGKEAIVVKGPDVDLKLSIEGRAFINADGGNNMPSGEIFTSPVEDSVEGTIRFTYPAIHGGREVDGVELTFEHGKVVKATAKKNEAYLLEMLKLDEGASVAGEFAIGTNKRIDRFTKNILFDEKIGGTIHMALGAGFKEIGGQNESGLHWDMICDMRDGGQIFVDGELFYESGDFKV
jgi:aminopeptidase